MRSEIARVARELDIARYQKRKVIFVDEICFTKQSNARLDYSRAHTNIEVGLDQNRTQYKAVIAGISWERGLEVISIHPHAINQKLFGNYIQLLVQHNSGTKLALFLD